MADCSPMCPGAWPCPNLTRAEGGRFFITMGHPGFNSPANNRQGYATAKAAALASARYAEKGRQRLREQVADAIVRIGGTLNPNRRGAR